MQRSDEGQHDFVEVILPGPLLLQAAEVSWRHGCTSGGICGDWSVTVRGH